MLCFSKSIVGFVCLPSWFCCLLVLSAYQVVFFVCCLLVLLFVVLLVLLFLDCFAKLAKGSNGTGKMQKYNRQKASSTIEQPNDASYAELLIYAAASTVNNATTSTSSIEQVIASTAIDAG